MPSSAKKGRGTNKGRFVWWLVLLVFVFVTCYSRLFIIPKFELTVVDAETKEPLEGVVFLAYWQLQMGSPAGTVEQNILDVRESVSVKDGKVGYDSFWRVVHWTKGWIRKKGSPIFAVYKEGYSGDTYHMVKRERVAGKLEVTKEFKGARFPIYGKNWDESIIQLIETEKDGSSHYNRSGLVGVLSKIEMDYLSSACVYLEVPHSFMAKRRMIQRMDGDSESSTKLYARKTFERRSGCNDFESYWSKYWNKSQ